MQAGADTLWDNAPSASVDIRSVLERAGLPTSTAQIRLLDRFRDYYASRGVLPKGKNPPLWRCCERRDICWAGVPDEWKRPETGGITLPWVGPRYDKTRVAVLADNLRNAGGLFVEQQVVSEVRAGFGDGQRRVHNSVFAYRSTAAAAALIANAAGEAVPEDKPDPRKLIPALDAYARLQVVKCSPADGALSTPPPAMQRESPDRYLADELRLAAPLNLLVLGRVARDAVARVLGVEWDWTPGLARGAITVERRQCDVYCVAHPAARGHWWRSWASLKKALA